MVGLLLNIIYSCHLGRWELLLEFIREVIPYAFAYDHVNYARYLTVMLGEMISLEEQFPEVYHQCIPGNFAAELSDGVFSRVETDKFIEMTINKGTKTPGGNTGFSANIGAVKQWKVNASYREELLSILHQHLHISKSIDLKRLFAKSVVIHKLEEDTEMANVRRVDHTLVVDGMACVTQSKTHDLSYQQSSEKLLKLTIGLENFALRTDVVFDVYKKNSIKNVDRIQLLNSHLVLKQIVPTCPIKQWGQLLSSGYFKHKVILF